MWNFQYKSEYEACVADLERSGAVQSMRFLPQHAEGVSTYDHASLVAYTSFRICSVLGLDARAAARGGLLHDLFLYNWQDHSIHSFLDHMENHPRYALENAEALFALTDTERDIISTHMWPATPTKFYHRWESLVVSCMDKVCAVAELLRLFPLITGGKKQAQHVPAALETPARFPFLQPKAG